MSSGVRSDIMSHPKSHELVQSGSLAEQLKRLNEGASATVAGTRAEHFDSSCGRRCLHRTPTLFRQRTYSEASSTSRGRRRTRRVAEAASHGFHTLPDGTYRDPPRGTRGPCFGPLARRVRQQVPHPRRRQRHDARCRRDGGTRPTVATASASSWRIAGSTRSFRTRTTRRLATIPT